MNICHIILTNNFAGSERYCSDLANYQSDIGHSVTLIIHKQSNKKEINIKNHINKKNINIEEIGLLFKKYQVLKILKKFKIQIIHCHLGKACKVVKGIDLPKVVTLHIDYRKKQHDHFDGIICINDNQFENLINFKKQKKVISNWLPLIGKVDKKEIIRIKNLYQKDKDKYIFGYFGRFNQSKNLELLIKAFTELKLNNSKLVLIGAGEQEKLLKKISISFENIEFFSSQNDIYPYYSLIDCFVLTSNFEPFGLVILEAMYFKKNIISSKVPISKFLPKNSIFEIGDKDQLKKIMMDKYNQGKKEIEYDLSSFNRKIQIDKVLKFYDSLIISE